MTGLKVIDGTPTEISKFLKEKKSQEENNVCECGHNEERHFWVAHSNKKGRSQVCSSRDDIADCPCKKFTLKSPSQNHSQKNRASTSNLAVSESLEKTSDTLNQAIIEKILKNIYSPDSTSRKNAENRKNRFFHSPDTIFPYERYGDTCEVNDDLILQDIITAISLTLAEQKKKFEEIISDEMDYYLGIKYNEKGYAYCRMALKVLKELLQKLEEKE